MACGVKTGGTPDLALVSTFDGRPAAAAGVFTTNLATAAPVQISRAHLHDGYATAVVLNSGNANAATGEPGRRDARRMCELAAQAIGCDAPDVLVCSTGLIGYPLPMPALESGIPRLAAQLGRTEDHGRAAADAILTTDTVHKEAVATFELDGATITVGGMAKGAAMLSPALATMLAVVTTDVAVSPRALHRSLERAVDESFNELSIDACTSTNDTVLVLANGAAGNESLERGPATAVFTEALTDVCRKLAVQMAKDAEGATKCARVVVRGARSREDARVASRAVADSQLVQCSLNGGDPYWGRVLSELGASGAHVDPEQVEIAYNGVVVCRDGVAEAHDRAALDRAMAAELIEIACHLHLGSSEAMTITTDLSHAYIDENRGTS
jgi:glutamate N-acetyltransferase/amino-acid N-acetyltransferase